MDFLLSLFIGGKMEEKKVLKISVSMEEIVDVFIEIENKYGLDGVGKFLEEIRATKDTPKEEKK